MLYGTRNFDSNAAQEKELLADLLLQTSYSRSVSGFTVAAEVVVSRPTAGQECRLQRSFRAMVEGTA